MDPCLCFYFIPQNLRNHFPKQKTYSACESICAEIQKPVYIFSDFRNYAQADGTGMVRVVDAAYAPSISADGKCLAYISENEVLLTDLNQISAGFATNTTISIGKLPTGRGTPNFKQDKLQWNPGVTP